MTTCAAANYNNCSQQTKFREINYQNPTEEDMVVTDKIVNVSICEFHFDWLIEHYNSGDQSRNLAMYGKYLEEAIHNNLFSIFARMNPVTEESRLFTIWVDNTDDAKELIILNGNDTIKPPTRFNRWKRVGAFHFDKYTKCIRETIQEIDMDEIDTAGGLDNWYYEMPMQGMHQLKPNTFECKDSCWCHEESLKFDNPIEWDSSVLQNYFNVKRANDEKNSYIACIEFIQQNLDTIICPWFPSLSADCDIGDWRHTEKIFNDRLVSNAQEILGILQDNNKAALHNAIAPISHSYGNMYEKVLWLLYTYVNHELHSPYKKSWKYGASSSESNQQKKSKMNQMLVELFVEAGLAKELLAIAISGERERYVDIHNRTRNDILYENNEVVELLVPAHVSMNEVIYNDKENEYLQLTPLQFWHYFNNSVFDVCSLYDEYFNKNYAIKKYLECYEIE